MHIYWEKLAGRSGHEAGRQALATLYARVTGESLPPIAVTPLGKPCFPDSPWHFSISHTKNHVFVALCDRPVGIDAEELGRKISDGLVKKALSPGEYAQYAQASDKNAAFLTFWVLKEAAAKCAGTGLRYPPNQTNFSLSDSRVQIIDGCLVALITEENHAL